MRTEETKLQKGDVVILRGTNWPAIVIENTRHKPLVKGYATVLLYVFGIEAEMGSAYVTDLHVVGSPNGQGVQVLEVTEGADEALMRRYAEIAGHNPNVFVAEARKFLAKRPKPKVAK
jgi:hypothetical protein